MVEFKRGATKVTGSYIEKDKEFVKKRSKVKERSDIVGKIVVRWVKESLRKKLKS